MYLGRVGGGAEKFFSGKAERSRVKERSLQSTARKQNKNLHWESVVPLLDLILFESAHNVQIFNFILFRTGQERKRRKRKEGLDPPW